MEFVGVYIRRNVDEIQSKTIAYWHKTEIRERRISRLGYYIPLTKECISMILGIAPQEFAARFYQLQIGHGQLAII